jgi:hypothetical protein
MTPDKCTPQGVSKRRTRPSERGLEPPAVLQTGSSTSKAQLGRPHLRAAVSCVFSYGVLGEIRARWEDPRRDRWVTQRFPVERAALTSFRPVPSVPAATRDLIAA